ncbi:hypothetical protein [Fulvimarina sp. MAC3]|uniref:hypothetical protein n=1 Tax=Fulvimarina sp. MAC3 TaxID=3148887 RepID=UPI0031FCB447
MKHWIVAAALVSTAFFATSSQAADSCGYFAFAGAFSSFSAADNRASRIGGSAWGLDSSDSPNAAKGFGSLRSAQDRAAMPIGGKASIDRAAFVMPMSPIAAFMANNPESI